MTTAPILTRRQALAAGAAGAAGLAFGPAFWRDALASPARPGPSPYGPLASTPDANGLLLPKGFTSRLVAQGGETVDGTQYAWHPFSDGMGTFATADGGWILCSNSEVPAAPRGGASAIRFGPDATIRDAYRILGDTTMNCAGGVTPWGTWLSCEETGDGQVWECDPAGRRDAVARPAMGLFTHEAVAVDPVGRRLYLTQDTTDAGWYRFTPETWGDLARGTLEIALVGDDGKVTWRKVDAAAGDPRDQVPEHARFQRGEGTWYDSGVVYSVTTFDSRIYAYEIATQTLEVLFDGAALSGETGLADIDNCAVAERSGDLFVCEDIDESSSATAGIDVGILTPERVAAKFLTATNTAHAGSELCGVCFDPSGTRMYVSSQRYRGGGAVFEVSGPFRLERPAVEPPELVELSAGELTLALGTLGMQRIDGFRRRWLPVRLRASREAAVALVLTADVRISGRRRRRLTLARGSATVGTQRTIVRLRPTPAAVRALRGRRGLTATLTATATAAGAADRVVRRIRLT